MEIILAGSLLGAGLLFNNKQETSRDKVTTNNPNNKNTQKLINTSPRLSLVKKKYNAKN